MGVSLTHQLTQQVAALQERGLYRQRQVTHEQDCVLQLSSNDYLSLAHDPRIVQAYQQGFAKYPVSSGASMVVCGYHAIHREVERAFSEALNVDDCLLFSSGYAANLSIMSMVARSEANVWLDRGVHASIYDGVKQANLSYKRYRHNDVSHLKQSISVTAGSHLVVTESIFSMSGQKAPLNDLMHIADDLLVDEAHAFGVLGREGLGGVMEAELTQEHVPLRIIPLGKAYAAFGAIVAGQGVWIDALLQAARPYIYSTGFSPACAYGLLKTLPLVQAADDRRDKLRSLVLYFRELIQSSPFMWRDSETPIQQLQLGCPHRSLRYAQALREYGIVCQPMRQPTVSLEETGLRVILTYQHEPAHLKWLFTLLHQIYEKERVK